MAVLGYINGLRVFETRAVVHDPANGQFTSGGGGAGKTAKAPPEHAVIAHKLSLAVHDHFTESKWMQGGCGILALGVSKWLSSKGIAHHLEAATDIEHVRVKVGKHSIEGSFHSPPYSGWHKIQPNDLNGHVLITPKRVEEVYKTVSKLMAQHGH